MDSLSRLNDISSRTADEQLPNIHLFKNGLAVRNTFACLSHKIYFPFKSTCINYFNCL